MDKWSSLFQGSQRLLDGWGVRESDLLGCDRRSGSVRYCLLKAGPVSLLVKWGMLREAPGLSAHSALQLSGR